MLIMANTAEADLASAPEDGIMHRQIVSRADQALSDAKRPGGDRVRVAD